MGYVNINRNYRHHPVSFDPHQKPVSDKERANVLRTYAIFDTPSEEMFSAFTELAALSLHTPIGLMSFVEEDEIFYKEAYGIKRVGDLVPRKNSPCSLAILSHEVVQFRYALSDPCLIADEKLLAESGYKFYAGAPLITSHGHAIGILAVVDKSVRIYTEDELEILKGLATEVMAEIEFRLQFLQKPNLTELNKRLKAIHARVEAKRP